MIALINYPVLFLRVLFFELAMNIPCVVLGDNRDFLECAALKKTISENKQSSNLDCLAQSIAS